MKTVIKILIVIPIIVAIPLVVAIFVKKDYSVIRDIEINKPKELVFDYIVLLKNQNNYSVWATADPVMSKSYTGIDGKVGFISAWDSNIEEVGKGEQEIIGIIPGERVDYELRFIKPFESTEKAYMTTESINDTITKVVWGFDGHMKYPSNLMFLFMDFDKMLGDDLSDGLKTLKEILE